MYKAILQLLIVCIAWSCTAQDQTKAAISNTKTNAMKPKVQKTEEEWKKQLSPGQYYVLRQKGTERPHTGKYNIHREKGVYTCAACNSVLFTSDAKFDSHCGWPSFDRALSDNTVTEIPDYSHGMVRTEIVCSHCGGHLGHVFDDGPTETGLRYCINSVSLDFEKSEEKEK